MSNKNLERTSKFISLILRHNPAVKRMTKRPVIYAVKSGNMARAGYVFYISANGVWLVKNVPAEFLERM